jgi:hypothetical protein
MRRWTLPARALVAMFAWSGMATAGRKAVMEGAGLRPGPNFSAEAGSKETGERGAQG